VKELIVLLNSIKFILNPETLKTRQLLTTLKDYLNRKRNPTKFLKIEHQNFFPEKFFYRANS